MKSRAIMEAQIVSYLERPELFKITVTDKKCNFFNSRWHTWVHLWNINAASASPTFAVISSSALMCHLCCRKEMAQPDSAGP